MSTPATIGLVLLVVIAVGWSLFEFFGDAQRVMAPDNADREAIEAEHGKDTPSARAEVERRLGRDRHWKDARTGLIGLSGILLLAWLWFG